MKLKYLSIAALSAFTLQVTAQEAYENTKMAETDLNGTARYVGMGGALDALGADISTISSNPAGMGLFRRSRADVSFGLVSQQDAKGFKNGKTTNASFDQVGFVYSDRTGSNSFLNIAFNYHKSSNFDYILNAAGKLNNASQNTLSFIKAIGGNDAKGASMFNVEKTDQGLRGTGYWTSQLDNLYYNNFIMDADMRPGHNVADGYMMNRANTGYIGEYDVNISGNINDRIYLGITAGLHDIHYHGVSVYTENLLDYANKPIGTLTVNDRRDITGQGFDLKAGIIFRPMANSPFRIGLSIATPTYYSLTTSNATYLDNGTGYTGYNKNWATGESYDFKLNTPWKFGLSLGHTVGNYLAIGASYDYADYGHMSSRINDGGTYDWYYDTYYESSHADKPVNNHTKATLKGVSTLKLGVEYKVMPDIAVRLGYNNVSPMYNMAGYKDGSLDSYASNYSSATDYTNWKSTNRLTVGVGYTIKKFNIDLAYQYSSTNGEFHPFLGAYGDYNFINTETNKLETEKINNFADAVKVSNKRHQLLLTLGYRL